MKKRNKVVMALAALTAVTAGVATTSTLAWFTTTRSVSVNFSNLAVKTGSGSLQVAYVAGNLIVIVVRNGGNLSPRLISGNGIVDARVHFLLNRYAHD